MIIDIEEGLLDLEKTLVKMMGVDPGVFLSDAGKPLLMEIALVYVRRIHLSSLLNEPLSEAVLLTEVASALYKAGQHEVFNKLKEMVTLIARYESDPDSGVYDDGPEGKAYYLANEFIEEAFRGIDDIIDPNLRDGSNEALYQFKLPTGVAGERLIRADMIVSTLSVLRFACGARNVYQDIVSSIALSH